MKIPIKGLMAATFTPMREDGSLKLEMVKPVVDHLINSGMVGLYVCGTTGEGHALTTDERRAVAEAYIDASAGRVPVIVHVGHNSLFEARSLADHARASEASAISAMLPWHAAARNVDTVADCIETVASAAPDLPFVFYHLPHNNDIDVVELVQRLMIQVPSVSAVKFTDPRTHILQNVLDVADGKVSVYFGVDEMLASGLLAGAQVAIGSTYNFAAASNLRIVDAVDRGDLEAARMEQARAAHVIRVILSHGGLGAQKQMMSFLGVDCGPTRLPHRALQPSQVQALQSNLDDIGFSGLIK